MRMWRAGRPLALADGGGRFEAAHLRHLHVHQHEVEGLPSRARRAPSAVVGDGDRVAALREQPDRDALVDDVVFGEQDAGARRLRGRRASSRAGRTGDRGWVRCSTRQIASCRSALPDRLGEIGRDAQLAAARESPYSPEEVSIMIVGAARSRPRGDLLRHREAVQLRHVGVEEHERERPAGAVRRCQRVDGVAAAVDGRRLHPPAASAARGGSGG